MSFLRQPHKSKKKLSTSTFSADFYTEQLRTQNTTQQTMAAMTDAEMMAVLALDSSDSNSDGNAGGGSMIAPAATEQSVNLLVNFSGKL